MEFLSINKEELGALMGLPHLQQLAYLRGIKPYMDVKTGIVGVKRKISHQSIAEQLYIEPHPGIKSVSFTKTQIRRAVGALERVGLITVQSEGLKLILKCNLASRDYSVQNKVITKPTHQAITGESAKTFVDAGFSNISPQKSDMGVLTKADTPLKDNNYIYLLSQFEQFWFLYPEKKSKQAAWEAFQLLNPDEALFKKIIFALEAQIKNRLEKEVQGSWLPPWKYPANWLAKRSFEDEIVIEKIKECKNAKNWKPNQPQPKDPFWCDDTESSAAIIPFKCRPKSS